MTTNSQRQNPRPGRRRAVADAIAVLLEQGLAPGDLMRLLGVSQPWVTRARAAGLPRRSDGRHDLSPVFRWVREREREKPPVPAAGESKELERWRRARADVAELDLEQRRGELVDRNEVVDYVCRTIDALKQRLRNMTKRLASRLYDAPSAAYCEEQIEEEVRAILRAFANGLDRAAEGTAEVPALLTDDLPPADAAGTTEREREETEP